MTRPKLIVEYVNAKDGVLVRIHERQDGYAVSVKDMDAGMELPDKKVFPTYTAAEIYALRCAF